MATPTYLAEEQFVGTIHIDCSSFDDFAAQKEEDIFMDLLGFELWTDLKANLTDQKYIDLLDGVAAGWDDGGTTQRRLKGIKAMLPYLFYYYYVQDQQTTATSVGNIELLIENGEQSGGQKLGKKMITAYNKGLVYYRELVDFINYQIGVKGETYYPGFDNTTLEKENQWGI